MFHRLKCNTKPLCGEDFPGTVSLTDRASTCMSGFRHGFYQFATIVRGRSISQPVHSCPTFDGQLETEASQYFGFLSKTFCPLAQ